MIEQQKSAIFGLNFLQDMGSDSISITGAYDPEQELWVIDGQVQASFFGNPTILRTTNISTNAPAYHQTNNPGGIIGLDVLYTPDRNTDLQRD